RNTRFFQRKTRTSKAAGPPPTARPMRDASLSSSWAEPPTVSGSSSCPMLKRRHHKGNARISERVDVIGRVLLPDGAGQPDPSLEALLETPPHRFQAVLLLVGEGPRRRDSIRARSMVRSVDAFAESEAAARTAFSSKVRECTASNSAFF